MCQSKGKEPLDASMQGMQKVYERMYFVDMIYYPY